MPAYSLIIVDRVSPSGRVSGTWQQDCCRGLAEATERCAGTSAVNGGQAWAVVPRFGGPTAFLDGERVDDVAPLAMSGALR